MTIWSCTILQINPKSQPFTENILTSPKKQYIYDVWMKPSADKSEAFREEPLKLYIDLVTSIGNGTRIGLQLDRESPTYFVRDAEPQQFRITVNLIVEIFKVSGWPSFVGVYGRANNVSRLRRAFKEVYHKETNRPETPIYSVGFRLREKTDALLQIFPNLRKMRVDGIQGSQIDSAILSGYMVEESPEFQRWVKSEEYGGLVNFYGVTVGDETVYVSNYGNMYSRQGKEPIPTRTVLQVLKGLMSANALVYAPTIDSFLGEQPK